jgi:hypothetical protein
MRIQTMSLPAEGWDFALIVDQCGEESEATTDLLRDFGRDIGAKSVLVTDATVELA